MVPELNQGAGLVPPLPPSCFGMALQFMYMHTVQPECILLLFNPNYIP